MRAGDRVPDVRVRAREAGGDGWEDRSLFELRFAGGERASAEDLDAYCRRWLTASAADASR
jgi:hypothetical protein